MAPILQRQAGDEWRPPPRYETGVLPQRTQARKPRVDNPQLVADERHLMDRNVASDVGRPRDVTGIMPASRRELDGQGWLVDEFSDARRRSHCQPVAEACQAHRLFKCPEVGVGFAAIGPNQDQLAGLIGGDRQRGAEVDEQFRERCRMDAAQIGGRCVRAGHPLADR